MAAFWDFILLRDPNVWFVVIGGIFIHASTATVGTFAYLRKRSLLGDGIAHALLPGVCLGFMISGEKNIFYLLGGAFVTGWLSTFLVDFIVNRSKLKQDVAIAIVLSSFFGLGIVLLTYIQKGGFGNHSGLDHFLFGQAAAISRADVIAYSIICAIIIAVVLFCFKSFKILSFNPEYAQSIGMPVKWMEMLMTSLTVLAIAAGIQALGVVLVSALIITPAAAARFWTNNLVKMTFFSVVIAIVSGYLGAFISYQYKGMPTGPWIVVFLSIITLFSFILAPNRGLIKRFLEQRQIRNKIRNENILKAIYQIHETDQLQGDLSLKLNASQLLQIRQFQTDHLMRGLKALIRQGYINQINDTYYLTSEGKKESLRIVRLHRLWEQYLLKRTTIDSDHVHSGAEAMEHILTPEIEAELMRDLGIHEIPEEDY